MAAIEPRSLSRRMTWLSFDALQGLNAGGQIDADQGGQAVEAAIE